MVTGRWLARVLLVVCLWLAPPSGCVAGRRGEEQAGHPKQLYPHEWLNVLQVPDQLAAQVQQSAGRLQPPVRLAGRAATEARSGGTSQLGSIAGARPQLATGAMGIEAELSHGGQLRPPPPAPPPPAAPPPPKVLPNFESTPMPQPVSIEEWNTDGSPLEMSSATFLSKGHPQPAYLAMCVVVRDAHADLLEWVHHHLRLGVGVIYVMDHGSQPPLAAVLAPHIEAGTVVAEHFVNFTHPSERPQLYAYDRCLTAHGHKHRWMAFTDVDEFLVFPGPNPVGSLPTFLRQYEDYSALAVHWVLFGSSGHAARPHGGTLRSYYRCLPLRHAQHTLVKSIANTQCTSGAWGPHAFHHNCSKPAVRTDFTAIEGPRGEEPVHTGLVLHHYALRSKEEFEMKMARGSGMRRQRGWEYFWFLDGWSVDFNFDGFYAWDDLRLGPSAAVDRGAQLQRYANDTHEEHWIRG